MDSLRRASYLQCRRSPAQRAPQKIEFGTSGESMSAAALVVPPRVPECTEGPMVCPNGEARPVTYSRHAVVRGQQRGIHATVVEFILEHADLRQHVGHNQIRLQVSRHRLPESREPITRNGGKYVAECRPSNRSFSLDSLSRSTNY